MTLSTLSISLESQILAEEILHHLLPLQRMLIPHSRYQTVQFYAQYKNGLSLKPLMRQTKPPCRQTIEFQLMDMGVAKLTPSHTKSLILAPRQMELRITTRGSI